MIGRLGNAFSYGAAYGIGVADKIGSIEVGKYADLVVLEQDPYEIDPLMIEEIDVTMTMMDGDFTYVRERDGEPTATSIDVFIQEVLLQCALATTLQASAFWRGVLKEGSTLPDRAGRVLLVEIGCALRGERVCDVRLEALTCQ